MSSKEERRRRELERLQKAIKRQKAESAQSEAASEVPQAKASEEAWDWNRFWDEFDAAGLKDKEVLFREALASEEMDGEAAVEMVSAIRGLLDTSEPQDRARYAELVEELRAEAPDVYRQQAVYYQRDLVSDAVAAGQWDDIPQLLLPFAEQLASDLDTFSQIIDQLRYQGRLQILIQVMTRAWPEVRDAEGLVPWAADEFADKLMRLQLFHYLETSDDPRADDPKLLEATAPYGEWEEVWLERIIRHLTRERSGVSEAASSAWKMADFGPEVDADQWQEKLSSLLLEFLADRRRVGVPYSRGDMAQMVLRDILMRQLSVPAEPFEIEMKGQAGGKRGGRRETVIPAPLPLVPRRELLDKELVDLFPMFGARPYHAAALMELLPPYLRFLARLGLIHLAQMDAALKELRLLSPSVQKMIRGYGDGCRAAEAVGAAWSGESLTALKDDPSLAQAREAPPEPLPRPEKPSPRPGAVLTYTFKVTYLYQPEIWRTIEIAGDQTLHRLHRQILKAVGFDSSHLYSFFMSNRAWDGTSEYSSAHTDGRSAGGVRIADLNLRMKQRFLYLYDYGDEHRFEVQLIDINPEAPRDDSYPRVLESHGEAPDQYQ